MLQSSPSLCGVPCRSKNVHDHGKSLVKVSVSSLFLLAAWGYYVYGHSSFFMFYSGAFAVLYLCLLFCAVFALCSTSWRCLEIFWRGNACVVIVALLASSTVAIFFYAFDKIVYVSADGDSLSPQSACQSRIPATQNSTAARPTIYEGVFPCSFYDGMVPFTPLVTILATMMLMFLSCCGCVLGQKLTALLYAQHSQDVTNESIYSQYLLEQNSLNSSNDSRVSVA
jgi:hypothetical protein